MTKVETETLIQPENLKVTFKNNP